MVIVPHNDKEEKGKTSPQIKSVTTSFHSHKDPLPLISRFAFPDHTEFNGYLAT